VVQTRDFLTKLLQAERFITVLAALLAGSNDDARRQVTETDGTLCLVDVLASGAARTEGLDFALPRQLSYIRRVSAS
jgi:hypothetical protein